MHFLLPIRIGRYTFYIRMMRYGNRPHAVLRSPGRLGRKLRRIRWWPIMRPEHLTAMRDATHLRMPGFPLPFRELIIEIYRHQPDLTASP